MQQRSDSMKTLKALKITSILQIIYCVYCFVPIICLLIGGGSPVSLLTDISILLFYFVVINPIAIICFIICLSYFLSERKNPEQRQLIGKKWIWIFIWPIIATILYITSGGLFAHLTGGV